MGSFEKTMTDKLTVLKNSTDVEFLKRELKSAVDLVPCCAAESLWRTNKINIIENRLLTLKTGACK